MMHLCRSGFLLCLFCVKNHVFVQFVVYLDLVLCRLESPLHSLCLPLAIFTCVEDLFSDTAFWLECLVLMNGAVDRVFFKSLHIGRFFVDTALCVMFELYNCLLLAQFYSLWFQFPAVNQGAKLLDGNFQKLIKILIYFNIYYNLIINGYCSLL